jgi:hypothetical protein
MDAEIRFVMTRELAAAANERIRKVRARIIALWRLGAAALLLVLLVATFFFVRLLDLPAELQVVVCAIAWLLITIGFIAGLVMAFRLRSRALAGFREKELVYRITDATFDWSMPGASGRHPWQIFVRLCPYPDFWLLFYTEANAFVLPAGQVQGAIGEFIESKVRQSDAGGAPVPLTAGSPPGNAAEGEDKCIMDRQIKVRFTQDLLIRGARRHQQTLGARLSWWFAFLCLLLVLHLVFSPLNPMTCVVCGLIALAIGWHVVTRLRRARWARKQVAQWGEYEATYRMTDEGLHVSTPYFNGVSPWSQFRKLHRFKDVWLLVTGPTDVLALPSESSQGEVGEFVVRRIRENGGEVR